MEVGRGWFTLVPVKAKAALLMFHYLQLSEVSRRLVGFRKILG